MPWCSSSHLGVYKVRGSTDDTRGGYLWHEFFKPYSASSFMRGGGVFGDFLLVLPFHFGVFFSFFSPLFFMSPAPTPWCSNSHLGQEQILKSKFLCQSVLMLKWLWVSDSPAKFTSQNPETAFLDALLPLQCFRLFPSSLASSPRAFFLFPEDPLRSLKVLKIFL